jgi:exonuclease III
MSNKSSSELDIVELNCKSITSKLQEIRKLISSNKPDILCFSETWLRANDREPRFHGYGTEWKHRDGRGGGLGIIIEDSIQYELVRLIDYPGGFLETLAIRINLSRSNEWLWIINVYNPNKNVTKSEIKHYLNQLGNKFILLGDVNAHTPVLDNKYHKYKNATGRSLENILTEENVILINPLNFVTYIDYHTGRPSCLDICLTSANIAAQTSLIRMDDVGSDHSPILAIVMLQPIRCIRTSPKRWNTTGTNWNKWGKGILASTAITPNGTQSLNDDFTNRISSAANINMKLSSGKIKICKSTPWWNAECSRRVALRRKAKKKCELHPTASNVADLRKKTSEAKYIILKSKKESWRQYVSSLSMDTPIGEVWSKIRKIKSQYVPPTLNIKIADKFIETNEEKANLFAKHYQEIGKLNMTKPPSDIEIEINSSLNYFAEDQEYNKSFTTREILDNIRSLKDTSPGIDNIPNIFLKRLPTHILEELTYMFNTSWQSATVPVEWKTGIVVPILKPGKEKCNITSYRPITLLSCVGKLLEKIICKRLEHWIEKNRKLGAYQCGFRKGLSTIDILLRLENKIRKSLDMKESCIVVYLDLKGAFDKVWHDGLLYKLAKMGIKGNLFRWIKDYLTDRKFMVRVGGTLSEPLDASNGVPQGAVLSPLLFNIMLSDMPIDNKIDIYCYADDLTFSARDKDIKVCTRDMQNYINRVVRWIEDWGFVVSQEKSIMQVFTTKRRMQNSIIRVKNVAIPCNKEYKLLGLILDAPKLTYRAHIDYLVNDIRKRLSIMKVISSISWGASKKVLRNFYIAYVRSKMDYGSVIYSGAAPSISSKLDKLQNVALRLILGAWKTSPILSMEVEAYIAPLKIRRNMLKLRQYLKLMNAPYDDVTAEMVKIKDVMHTDNSNPTRSFTADLKDIIMAVKMVNTQCRYQERIKHLPPWESHL